MNIYELIKLSIKSLFGFKIRSFLTTLGIIVGIGSVILISSIGAGFEKSLLGEFRKSHGKVLHINLDDLLFEDIEFEREMLFDNFDIINLSKIPNVEYVFVSNELSGEDLKGEEMHRINYLSIDGIEGLGTEIVAGREITKEEYESNADVSLISRFDAIRLFGSEKKAIGKIIKTRMYDDRKVNLTIVGVFKDVDEKFRSLFGTILYKSMIAPLKDINENKTRSIFVRVKNEENIEKTIISLKEYLKNKSNENDIYRVEPLSKDISMITEVLNKISIFISLIASISLIVGGIGVMNIMLVSVTERISEIGLRKAIGAKNRDILYQFLIESIILTVIGGIIGIIFGYFIAFIIGLFFSVIPILKLNVLVVSILISMTIGIIFGIYPAKKAAKLSPMEALRSE